MLIVMQVYVWRWSAKVWLRRTAVGLSSAQLYTVDTDLDKNRSFYTALLCPGPGLTFWLTESLHTLLFLVFFFFFLDNFHKVRSTFQGINHEFSDVGQDIEYGPSIVPWSRANLLINWKSTYLAFSSVFSSFSWTITFIHEFHEKVGVGEHEKN